MVTLDTLRARHEHDHKLAAYCPTCERWAVLDPERLRLRRAPTAGARRLNAGARWQTMPRGTVSAAIRIAARLMVHGFPRLVALPGLWFNDYDHTSRGLDQ